MIVGRIVGALIFLAGTAVLVRDLLVWLDTGRWMPLVVGQVWFDLDHGSMTMAELAVERHLGFTVWDPVITSLLACWVFAVLMVLGAAAVGLCQETARRP